MHIIPAVYRTDAFNADGDGDGKAFGLDSIMRTSIIDGYKMFNFICATVHFSRFGYYTNKLLPVIVFNPRISYLSNYFIHF